MVKAIQRNKMEVNGLRDLWGKLQNESRSIAEQQTRLANATVRNTPGGMEMYLPSINGLKRMGKEIEISNRQLRVQAEMISAVGTQVQNWGKNMQWAGRQLMVGFTIPFIAASAAAGVYAYQVDQQLTRIQKVYDGADDNLRQTAMNTSKAITQVMGTSTKENLDVMAQLAAVGLKGAELQKGTAEVQRLTTLGEMDRLQSLNAVITLQSTFRMNTLQTADAINYMNAVENATSLSMQDFAEALPRAAAPVAELGGTIQELGTIMVAMKERGIDAGEGANAIKTLMNRLLNPAKETQLLFKQLTNQDLEAFVKTTGGKLMPTLSGLAEIIKNSNLSLVEQQQLIGQLGGSYQMTRLTSILQGLASEGGQVAKAMDVAKQSSFELANTASEELRKQTESLSGQFKIALSNIQSQLQAFGEMALSAATKVLQIGGSVLEFINNLPPIVRQIIGVGFTGAAIAGPVVMLIGLMGNLIGSVAKGFGAIMGLGKKYRTMSLESKAAELAAGSLNSRILTQADSVQILAYQLDKLKAAYLGTMRMGVISLGGRDFVKDSNGHFQRYDVARDKLMGPTSYEEKAQIASYLKAQGSNIDELANKTEKASLAQRAFRQETLLGAAAVAGLFTLVSDTGSGFGKWAGYISIAATALAVIQPMLSGLFEKMKGTGDLDGAQSRTSRMFSAISEKASRLGSMIFSPIGLAALGVTGAIVSVFTLINAKQNEIVESQKRMANTAEGWAKSLGFVKLEIGAIRDKAGGAEDTFNSLVERMKKDNVDVVNAFKEPDQDKMYDRIRKEIYKLQSQGLDPSQIENGIKAALVAAGKTKTDVEKIMSHIKVDLDFTSTRKTTDKFINDVRNNLAELSLPKNSKFYKGEFIEINDSTRARLAENAKLFFERLNTIDPAQQAYLIKQMQEQYNSIHREFFDKTKNNFINDQGKSGQQARAFSTYREAMIALTDFDPSKGFVAKTNEQSTFVNELLGTANATREFAIEIGKLYNVSGPALEKIKDFSDLMPYVKVNSMTSQEAVKGYNEAVKTLESGGTKLTEQQKLQIAEIYAAAGGLDAAALAAGAYSDEQKKTKDSIDATSRAIDTYLTQMSLAARSNEIFSSTLGSDGNSGWEFMGADAAAKAQYMTNMQKDVFSGTMSTIYDVFSAQAEEQFNARMDAIANGFERRKDALEAQAKNLDKQWDQKMRNFQDSWESTMKSTKKAFDQRKKDIDAQAEAQENAIDAQIDAIERQKDAEKELDDARQRAFEAEERRAQRLAELQNGNIDYNRALAEGNVDEAARIQNNLMAKQAGWASEDSQEARDALNAQKEKEDQARIDALQQAKDRVNDEKQAKLDALQIEQEATEESLRAQQEAQQRSLDAQREMEKERLQNRISSLSKEQQAVEASERRKQEMNRRTLEIELATLKAFVPANEAQLNAHIGRVQGAYNQHGVQLTIKGGQWGQIVGSALQNNVDRARMQMSNDYQWQTAGAAMADAITKGAFGLSLGDFFNMIISGKPPAGWTPPGASKGIVSKAGFTNTWHKGGYAADGKGSGRLGRTGPLYGDEFPAVLQRGEYVLQKDAVSRLGTSYLDSINTGTNSNYGVGGADVGFAGLMAGVAGTMMRTIIEAVFLGSQDQNPTFNGKVANTPGTYGGRSLSAEQLNNANVIASVGKSMGATPRDIVIALMTAMQESTLRNINYGDRDSLGLFQQRPSQGWGTPAQVTNPVYASQKFFSALFGVKNRNSMPLTLAAQAVQRSAFPLAYAKWQSMAEALLGVVGNGTFSSGLPGFGMFMQMMGMAGNSGFASMPTMGNGQFMKPVNGRVTSEFGLRTDPFTGKKSMHDGIDIGAASGTPIYSTGSGRVISAGMNGGGFGNWTLIDHGGGVISGYAHQSRLAVAAGQAVNKGQLIGYVGSTGRSTGPHLHFQMGSGPGKFQNPRNWVPGLKTGGYIKYDNTLANLHKNETVLTAPLSDSLKRGIDNMEQGGNSYAVEVNFNGVTPNISKDDIISGVMEALNKNDVMNRKRTGR